MGRACWSAHALQDAPQSPRVPGAPAFFTSAISCQLGKPSDTNLKHFQRKGRVYLSWKQCHGLQRTMWLMLYWDFQRRAWQKPSASECHSVPRPGLSCLARTEDGLGAWCQMEMLPLIQQIQCCAQKIWRSWRRSRVMVPWGSANKQVIHAFLPHRSPELETVIPWLAAGCGEPCECSLHHPGGFGTSPPAQSPGKRSSATPSSCSRLSAGPAQIKLPVARRAPKKALFGEHASYSHQHSHRFPTGCSTYFNGNRGISLEDWYFT